MPIITSMTTVTEASSSRCLRIVVGRVAALALVVGLTCAPAHAANDKSSQPVAEKAASGEHLAGTVLCNGIRLEDEIDVINTRSICGAGDSEFMRKGLKVEAYAVCDEIGHRKWQSSDFDSFVNYDPTVPTIIFVHGNQIMP